MTKTLKIPPEQQTFIGGAPKPGEEPADRRDLKTGVQSGQPGDGDVNLNSQGRFGNLKQNLTPQWKTQAR